MSRDEEFVKDLAAGLLVNEKRYGYQSCPCRLSGGSIEADRDIICPCDYREQDISERGGCYCGLYVSEDVFKEIKKLTSIPERRPPLNQRNQPKGAAPANLGIVTLTYPVHRCNVCGYLCARETPPEVCPICKTKKDRFERFL